MLISSVLVVSLFSFINAETINVHLDAKDELAICKSDEKFNLNENSDIIVNVTSQFHVNGFWCSPKNHTSNNGTDKPAIFQYGPDKTMKNETLGKVFTKKIGVVTNLSEWDCTFLILLNNGKIKPILKIGNITYTAPVCSMKFYVQRTNPSKDKNGSSNKWVYIGVSIGMLIAIVLALQSYAVFYFKKKAQTAAMHSRFQNLSIKSENDSGSDRARYQTKLIPVPRPESVESSVYETIDVCQARMEAQREKDISTRPPVPIPVEETYEDVDSILERSGHVIPPPMAPSVETLPRKPKQAGTAMLQPLIQPNLPSQSSSYPKPKKSLPPPNPPGKPKQTGTAMLQPSIQTNLPSQCSSYPKPKKSLPPPNPPESNPMANELDLIFKKRRLISTSTSQESSVSSSTPFTPHPSQPKPKSPPVVNASKPTKPLFNITKKTPTIDNPAITPQVNIAPVKPQMAKAPITNAPLTPNVTKAPVSPRSNNVPRPSCKEKPLPPLPEPKPHIPSPPKDEYNEEVYYDTGEWEPEYLTQEHIYNV